MTAWLRNPIQVAPPPPEPGFGTQPAMWRWRHAAGALSHGKNGYSNRMVRLFSAEAFDMFDSTFNLLLRLGMRDINAYCTVESYFHFFLFVLVQSGKWLADLCPQNQDVPISAAFRLQKAQAPRPKARRERWKESKDLEKVKVMKVVKVVKVHQDRFLYFFWLAHSVACFW